MTIRRRIRIKFRKLKMLFILIGLFGASFLLVTTAPAALSLLGSQETQQSEDRASSFDSFQTALRFTDLQSDNKPQTRAPEPSTIALFGSGVIGMIMSFVRRTYTVTKRTIDIVCSIVALFLLFPLAVIVALLIKLTSRGPVLFTQTRVGKDGRFFEIYKFRTMMVDAEKETGPVWAAQNDARLTPVGSWLRRTHIDEIPQFLNVLRGEMSIIGPRPERPVFVNELRRQIKDYEKRLLVKPGITGLAQVWHRYDETIQDVRKKIKYDLLYIKRMCLWADLRILLRTVRVVVTGEGAR